MIGKNKEAAIHRTCGHNLTSKEKLVQKLKAKYPKKDYHDDQVLMQDLMSEYDQIESKLQEHQASEKSLLDMLTSDPRAADFLSRWNRGEDPTVALMRMYGDEFRDALDDDELREKLSEARADYIARVNKSNQLNEQSEKNLEESLNYLDALQERYSLSDSQISEVYSAFSDIINDAVVNRVLLSTWEIIYKAISYDNDVASAAHEGEVRGKNTKIQELKRRHMQSELPPQLPAGSAETQPLTMPDLGALARADRPNIFTAGKMRRVKNKA